MTAAGEEKEVKEDQFVERRRSLEGGAVAGTICGTTRVSRRIWRGFELSATIFRAEVVKNVRQDVGDGCCSLRRRFSLSNRWSVSALSDGVCNANDRFCKFGRDLRSWR